jgi:hypothetical protein
VPDDADPPRKFYALKSTREFPISNPPTTTAPASPAPKRTPPAAPPSPAGPIDVRDHLRDAGLVPKTPTERSRVPSENEVHGILRDNLARANEAGLNTLSYKEPRRSRRKKDYFFLMALAVPFFGFLAWSERHNVVVFVSSIAGLGIFTAGVTWVMWFVMDDY